MTDSCLLLGCDPGPERHGWALLALDSRGRGAYIASGSIAADPLALRGLIAHLRTNERLAPSDRPLLAIERPVNVYRVQGATQLLATARTAGWLEVEGEILGLKVQSCAAESWRQGLLRTRNASDAMVSAYVLRTVKDWPKRSVVHARDAAGVALYLGQRARFADRTAVTVTP